jgi:2-amino-4-hydroxy-6-hydroxymethyldihydropteridine diphosphokinase
MTPARRRAAIALGSNLGDRHAHITAAVDALAALPGTRVVAISTLVQTEPVPSPGSAPETVGGPFLNGAAIIETTLEPHALLDALLAIERAHLRRRDPLGVWTPRTLDLDLILYDDLTIATPTLTIPHPRMASRGFVLEPLAQIAPDWRVPTLNRTVSDLLADLRQGAAS